MRHLKPKTKNNSRRLLQRCTGSSGGNPRPPETEDEVQRIKNQLEARKIRELQSVAVRADYLNQFAMYFNDPNLINTEIDRYEKVTADDIWQLGKKYLQTNNRIVLHFLPE